MLKISKTGEELKYFYKYPHPSVTIDCVIFGFDGTKNTIAFYALVRMQEVKGGDDAVDAQWFALEEVPQLIFDHG